MQIGSGILQPHVSRNRIEETRNVLTIVDCILNNILLHIVCIAEYAHNENVFFDIK